MDLFSTLLIAMSTNLRCLDLGSFYMSNRKPTSFLSSLVENDVAGEYLQLLEYSGYNEGARDDINDVDTQLWDPRLIKPMFSISSFKSVYIGFGPDIPVQDLKFLVLDHSQFSEWDILSVTPQVFETNRLE